MCGKCEKISVDAILGNAPTTAPTDTSVLVRGNTNVTIKPFATLDDAVVSASKVANLAFPEFAGEEENDVKYVGELIGAVSALSLAKQEDRYDALINVLGLTLMGFDPTDLEGIKESLNERLTKVAARKVNEQTEAFLKGSGFIHDMNA